MPPACLMPPVRQVRSWLSQESGNMGSGRLMKLLFGVIMALVARASAAQAAAAPVDRFDPDSDCMVMSNVSIAVPCPCDSGITIGFTLTNGRHHPGSPLLPSVLFPATLQSSNNIYLPAITGITTDAFG